MSIFKELFESLKELVSAAEKPKVTDYGDSRRVLVSANGTTEEKFVPADEREHKILQIEDFISAANRWGVQNVGDGASESVGVIFHSPARIVLVTDDSDRRDKVTMDLVESDTFRFLRTVGERTMDHKTFVRALKTILHGKAPDGLLAIIRKIEVATGERRQAEVVQGRERGMREFQAELANASELPEFVNIVTPVYSNYGLRTAVAIHCTLEVELPALTFRLAPLPDVLNIAVEGAQADIHERLVAGVEEGIEVFHGEP